MLSFLLFLTLAGAAGAQELAMNKAATYWMTVGEKVRPGVPLDVMVQILAGQNPVDISFTLLSPETNRTLFQASFETVSPGDVRKLTINVPGDIEKPSQEPYGPQKYKLRVTGQGQDVNFKNESHLYYDAKNFSIFIQTDKAIYKPSHQVKIRVLAMTSDQKVFPTSMDIVIKDPRGNRIWQNLGATSDNGNVLEFIFPLAAQVPLGEWSIHVTIMGVEESITITVSDYVLPKFEVEVIAPSFGETFKPLLQITVRAKYTFGQPVTKGRASVKIRMLFYYGRSDQFIGREGEMNANGEFTFEVTTQNLLDHVNTLEEEYGSRKAQTINYRIFSIEANVTEHSTGRVQGDSTSIQYYDVPLKITFMPITPSNFKAGMNFTAYVEVTKQDGTLFSPLEAKNIKLNFSVYHIAPSPEVPANATLEEFQALPRPEWEHFDLQDRMLPDSGWIAITFRVPDTASIISVRAYCKEPYTSVYDMHRAYRAVSPSNSYLQMRVPVERPKVGDTIEVTGQATDELTQLHFQVYSKGMLVSSYDVPGSGQTATLNLALTHEMAPSMQLVAFYVRPENNEFVADTVTLNIDGLFQKPVSVSFSKDTVEPGERLDVTVEAEEGSLVYLVSNDKSVELLKSGNALTPDLVRQELERYQYGQYYPWMRYAFICGWPYYPSSKDVAAVFAAAKTIVLTDGWVYKEIETFDDRFVYFDTNTGAPVPETASAPKAEAAGSGRVRKVFPENWLWNTHLVNSNGQLVFSVNAPDTITSWVTSVFSVHPDYGLSVGLETVELTTFKDFFISLDLPISIVQGEEYCFTSSVFSYNPNPAMTMLTLQQSDDFEFLKVTRQGAGPVAQGSTGSHSIVLGELVENDAESAMFCVKPGVIGKTPVLVSATTNIEGVSDAVMRTINVKAAGAPRTTTYSFLLDLSNGAWEQNVDIRFPDDTVAGSESITFIATGNLLAPVLENIGDLLRQPYGCGEQNMINFVPNIYLAEFLFKTDRLDAVTQEKARGYMLSGYVKELTYEHGDGGFSAFGDRDEVASLWLTAFVTKAFSQAEKLNAYLEMISIDPDVIARSVRFIMRQQNRNGSFTEHGVVFNKRLQSGSGEGEALVAYTLIALHEALEVFLTHHPDGEFADQISGSIARAKDYLESRIPAISDPYDICIGTYALYLVNSQRKQELFNKMERIAVTEDGMKYWKRPQAKQPVYYYWSRNQDALSIEMTAYALLATSLRGGDSSQVLPIISWLAQQRGPHGGFHSTQDTVTALQALTVVSVQQNIGEFVPLAITLTYSDASGDVVTNNIDINKDSELLLQHIYIPYEATTSSPNQLRVRGETLAGVIGSSSTMAEVVLKYNVRTETSASEYMLSHELRDIAGGFELTLKVRTTDNDPASMSILQVDIPAGYEPSVHENQNVSRVEISEDGESLNIYFTSNVIGPAGVVVGMTMNSGGDGNVLASSTDKFYGVYNYYEKDFEVKKKYSIDKNQKLCTSVPKYSICPAAIVLT